jgi:DNA-binding CsgD family transcriptional regulator
MRLDAARTGSDSAGGRGKTTKELATALCLSVKTAETHRTNLMRKLNLHSIADISLYAVRHGIVQIF